MDKVNTTAVSYALWSVTRDIGAVGKDNTNAHHKYKFRSIDQFLEALQPMLVKHQLVLLQEWEFQSSPLPNMTNVKLRLTFESVLDGSQRSATFLGQGTDTQDKGLYKAMAGAMKYAIAYTFSVRLNDEADAEFDHTSNQDVRKLSFPKVNK